MLSPPSLLEEVLGDHPEQHQEAVLGLPSPL